MSLELNLRVVPVVLCAVFAAADAVGQAAAESATKSMKAPPTAGTATQIAPEGQAAPRGVRIGVTINPLTEALAAQLGLEASKGILVEDVVDGGPAAKAGLARYDVIVAMNDEPVSSEKGLRDHLAGLHAGDTVTIKVMRKGETMLIPVVAEERPADAATLNQYGNSNSSLFEKFPQGQAQDSPQWREWAEKQRAWAEQVAKQQTEWSEKVAEQSRAYAEQFQKQHQADIDKWTAELVDHVEAWRKQADELNSPENRAKYEEAIRTYVNQLVEQARAGVGENILRLPAIRYYTTQDGKNQAVVEGEAGAAADAVETPADSADVSSRLEAIEQRMQKIEQMLEKIANGDGAKAGGK